MDEIQKDLIEVVRAALATLGLETEVTEGADAAKVDWLREGVRVRIDVLGDLATALLLECSEEMARFTAGRMFSIDPSDASRDDLRDAVGELVNVIGGNVGSMLGTRSRLGLPVDPEDATGAPLASKPIEVLQFASGDARFDVSLVALGEDPEPSERG